MPQFSDFYFPSSRGAGRNIHARKCVPDGAVKGVVQIAHGIAEHINRYDDFMRFLAENGFVAVGNDHLGHGATAATEEDKGYFADRDGWSVVVSDMVKLHDLVSAEYPAVPYIMFGHSMGSFLTRTYIIENPAKYDLVILSGTGHMNKAVVLGGCTLADTFCRIFGRRGAGDKLDSVAFGSYLKKIQSPRTKFDWLSRDNAAVDAYASDPNCGFVCKNGLYRDMLHGVKFIIDQNNINKMSLSKPVYFMSGDADPVGDYGAGVERAYKAFLAAGCENVTIRLYPEGRHEMLNEINKDQVYSDILAWITKNI